MPQSTATTESSATDVYYSCRSNLTTSDYRTDHDVTYVKTHQQKLRQVYRLKPPPDSELMRDYVIQYLPGLNLSGRITRIGEHPVATNGAFGDVWLGIVDDRKVAVKVTRAGKAKETDRMEKTSLRELFNWSHLTHENVLDMLGFTFDYGPFVAYVSEWQENGTATEFVEGKSLDIVCKILQGAACGLAYLHSKRIVHGDFRGNNLLIDGQHGVLVSDFGMSRIEQEGGFASSKDPGGNIRWMAPELFEAGAVHTMQSDAWAFGMTILELCSSSKPYSNIRNDAAVLLGLVKGTLPFRDPVVPCIMWALCKRLWTMDQLSRPSIDTIKDFLICLAQVIGSPGDATMNLGPILLSAVRNNNLKRVVFLLELQEVDVNSRDLLGRTAVSHAATTCNPPLLRRLLSQDDVDINLTDHSGRTPLSHAAEDGDPVSLHLLLERTVDVNSKDRVGRTALSYAAASRLFHNYMKMLLGRTDIEADLKDDKGRTPLSYAAEMVPGLSNYFSRDTRWTSTRRITEAGMRCHIEADGKDNMGRTPLSYAAEHGDEDCFRLLLKRHDVDVNSRDRVGRTPLSYTAASQRSHNLMKVLLERTNIEADLKDDKGRTPLSYAAKHGDTDSIRLLLKRDDVDVNSRDRVGRTALSYAAVSQLSYRMVLLLERTDIEADLKDDKGRTPLSYAAEHGSLASIKLLLNRDEVDINAKDNTGRTALSYATCSGLGHTSELLERTDIEADGKDNMGRTPLSYAAEHANVNSIRLLLKRDDVDVTSKDNTGRTALSYAACRRFGHGHTSELLGRTDIEADGKDNMGRTPLSYAAEHADTDSLKLLLNRDDVDVNSRDRVGRTPLSYAAASRLFHNYMKMLLGRTDIEADLKDDKGRTPLSYAAENGARSIQLLLERYEVDINAKDNRGRNALSYAAGSPFGRISELLERTDIEAEGKDNMGRAPLSYAAEHGKPNSIKLLLERDDVDVNSRDRVGRTPLSYVAASQSSYCMEVLLERTDIEADLKDDRGRTPLSYAAEHGNLASIKLLLKRDDVDVNSRDHTGTIPQSYLPYDLEGLLRL